MAMTARNLNPEAPIADDLAASLHADLRRVDGRHPAWELWQGFSGRLRALSDDESLDGIDASMTRLRAMAEGQGVDHRALARLAVDVSTAISALRRRVRKRMMEARSR